MMLIVCIYVDDLVFIGNSQRKFDNFKKTKDDDDKEEEEDTNNNQELQQVKNYIESLNKSELSLSDLQTTNTENPTNYTPWILGSIGIVAVGIIAWLLVRNNKRREY